MKNTAAIIYYYLRSAKNSLCHAAIGYKDGLTATQIKDQLPVWCSHTALWNHLHALVEEGKIVRRDTSCKTYIYEPVVIASDPMFLRDGKFYFYSETWSEEHGPFATYKEAQRALGNYASNL